MNSQLSENEIAKEVVDAALIVHRHFGPGLFETVYEVVLCHELRKRGFEVERQIAVPIIYDSIRFEEGFKADVLVNQKLLLELKSLEHIGRVHKKQVLTYLRLMDLRLGLLINFGDELLKENIHRIVNNLNE